MKSTTNPLPVSDAEIAAAFRSTNFGHTNHQALLSTSVLKRLLGYHCGHIITTIMKELKLIGKNRQREVLHLFDQFSGTFLKENLS